MSNPTAEQYLQPDYDSNALKVSTHPLGDFLSTVAHTVVLGFRSRNYGKSVSSYLPPGTLINCCDQRDPSREWYRTVLRCEEGRAGAGIRGQGEGQSICTYCS